jgi:hypothetical protein
MSKVEEIMALVDYWGAHYGENPAVLNGIRKAIEAIAQPAGEAEPVAVVCADFALHWAGSGPIAPICEKHGIKVGTKLYTIQQQSPLTDEQILAGAREMNRLECDLRGLDEEDSWKLYGNSYIIDTATILRAAHGIKKGGTE